MSGQRIFATHSPELDRLRRMALECKAGPFLERLVTAGSRLGIQLASAVATPLRSYLATLIPRGPRPDPGGFRELVARALAMTVQPRPGVSADDVCQHLLDVPVIQQADHSNLLLDQETFLNNYFFHLASKEAGVGAMIVSQCSAVSCISKRVPISGPTFLRTRESLLRVFPMSNRLLKHSTFCALPMPTRIAWDVIQGDVDPRNDPFLARFADHVITDPAEGYRVLNDRIWSSLDIEGRCERVAVDEAFASDILALHLEAPASPLAALIFEEVVRDAFLDLKRDLVASPDNLGVNRAEPDFFWLRKGSRLVPLVVHGRGKGARFRMEVDGAELAIPFERRAISRALRDRVLYCDRVLAYATRCLVPGIVAVGGSSQQDYVHLYQKLFLATHQQVAFLDEGVRDAIADPGASRLGGAPLVELNQEQWAFLQRLGPELKLVELERVVLDRTVGESIGRLSCASYFETLLRRREDRLNASRSGEMA